MVRIKYSLRIPFVFVVAFACGGDSMTPEEPDFAAIYNDAFFQNCKNCHAPGAGNFVEGKTEATQDWTTVDTAFASLQGKASGMMGDAANCNGVPLIGDTPETSLLVAALDKDIRDSFSVSGFPDCDQDAISDMATLVGSMPAALLIDLKAWIDAGAPKP